MSYQREREEFIVAMEREGMPAAVARLVLRHANTIQRLAVVECNGDDWASGNLVACPNADRPVRAGEWCPECSGTGAHGQVTRSSVRTLIAERRVTALCAGASSSRRKFAPVFGGDPRGACVKLVVPSRRTNDGGSVGICVPTRRW